MRNLTALLFCLALCACGGGDDDVVPAEPLATSGWCTSDGFNGPMREDGTYPRCNPCPGATGYACPL